MKKPVVAVAIVMLGIGAFTMLNAKPAVKKNADAINSGNTLTPTGSASAAASSVTTETIDKALGSGGSFACTFDNKNGGTSGKIFVSDKKFRADWKSTIETHIIYDGTWYYIFGGKSINLKVREDKKTFAEAVKAAIDMKTSSNLICFPWIIDEKIFELPEGKNFPSTSDLKQNPSSPSAK
jgi:hypothetical protein